MRTKAGRAVLATLSLSLMVGTAAGAKRWTKVIPAAGRTAVDIGVVVAQVTVVASDRADIRLEAVGDPGGPEPKVKVTQRGIEIKWKPREGHDSEVSRSMIVQVPRRLLVAVKTLSGSVQAKLLAAALKIKTLSGEVKVLSCSGPIKVKAVSGGVLVHRASGRKLEVKTVSGAVTVKGAKLAELQVRTVSGEIDVSSARARQVRLRSYSGSISVDARVEPSGELGARTLSGNVNVRWPSGTGFGLNARTLSGKLEVGFPLAGVEPGAKEASGTVGKGGTKISMRTLSGDLQIRPR